MTYVTIRSEEAVNFKNTIHTTQRERERERPADIITYHTDRPYHTPHTHTHTHTHRDMY